MKLSKNTKGVLLLFTSALLYSIMPVFIRILGQQKMPPSSQVFLRYIFAFLAASIYFFFITRSKIKLNTTSIPLLLLTTIFGYALTNLFFTYGILYTKVSNALFLFYCYGIITPVLGFFILKEKLTKYNLIALTLSFIALLLLFQPNSLPTWKIGAVFSLIAAVGQSVYLVLRGKLLEYPAKFMTLANTFVGVIVLGALSLIFDHSFYSTTFLHLSLNTWIVTIIFGLDNFLGWFCMTKGFEYFKSSTGSVILLVENVFSVTFALLFFKEIPTIFTLIGGALILASTIIVILKNQE